MEPDTLRYAQFIILHLAIKANSLLKDKTQRLEMETLSAKQLSDEVKILKNKLLIFEKYDKSGNSEELEVYKVILLLQKFLSSTFY